MNMIPSFNEHGKAGPVPRVRAWERTYATWLYVGTLLACIAAVCLGPFTYGVVLLVPPLLAIVLWVPMRSRSMYVDNHGLEVFSIVLATYFFAMIGMVTGLFFAYIAPFIAVFSVFCLLWGAWHAFAGRYYRAPICCRLRL